MSLQILKFLLNYNTYVKYSNYITTLYKDNKELNTLLKHLQKQHDLYKKDLTLEEFSLFVLSNCLEKDKPVFEEILTSLSDIDTDSVILADVFADVMQRQEAYNLALAALEVSEGRKEFADLLTLARSVSEQSPTVSHCTEELFVTTNLEELYHDSIQTPGLRWRLQTLNRMLGSLRRGDFGFIFARPETGKTTFLVSEVSNFAQQLHARVANNDAEYVGPILWFNNEEQGNKVQLRLYQAMLGCDLTTLWSDMRSNQQKFTDLGGEYIRIFDSASIHRKQVDQLCQELRPSMVIFDQIDKIKGFDGDREDLRLGSIYVWAREIAKEYCPVIGVCQADASGEGKRWLTMENVSNAKTSKAAEADWVLGIGKTHDVTEEYMRHLHLSKNKLAGDVDSDPEQRHGRNTVRIRPDVARYEDIDVS